MGRDERPIFNCLMLKITIVRPHPLSGDMAAGRHTAKSQKMLFIEIPSSSSPVENKFRNRKGMMLK